MPKKLARKGAFWHFKNPKLFPEKQLQMEYSKLLMFPENIGDDL